MRKKSLDNKQSKSISLPEQLIKKVEEKAQTDKRTFSQTIELLIENCLQNNENFQDDRNNN